MLPGEANTVPVPNRILIVDEIKAWTITQGPVITAPSTLIRCCMGAARIIPIGIVTSVLKITFKATKAAENVMYLVNLLMVVPTILKLLVMECLVRWHDGRSCIRKARCVGMTEAHVYERRGALA